MDNFVNYKKWEIIKICWDWLFIQFNKIIKIVICKKAKILVFIVLLKDIMWLIKFFHFLMIKDYITITLPSPLRNNYCKYMHPMGYPPYSPNSVLLIYYHDRTCCKLHRHYSTHWGNHKDLKRTWYFLRHSS